ncbi:unnamed protein product [Ilex paraguariensis]|uniref:Uncharacterized protein n=1 Tax=Ilex paraguariensis TaxID=185542 RepID=A0ABC8UFA5_9AQUA
MPFMSSTIQHRSNITNNFTSLFKKPSSIPLALAPSSSSHPSMPMDNSHSSYPNHSVPLANPSMSMTNPLVPMAKTSVPMTIRSMPKGKEKEWKKVTRKGGPKSNLKANHQITKEICKSKELSESGKEGVNNFNVLLGEHSGKDGDIKESIEVVLHNDDPSNVISNVRVPIAKEKEVLNPPLSVIERDHGFGVSNKYVSIGEDGKTGYDNMKACDEVCPSTHLQGETRDVVLLEDGILECLLNQQHYSSASSSFLVDHSYKRRGRQNFSVDDENGLIRDKEPPNKGFSSDQESTKNWVDMIEDSADDEAHRLALVTQIVDEYSDSSTGCSPRENVVPSTL